MILLLLLEFSSSYQKSIWGYTGTDTVQCQECDSLVVLEEVPKPTIKFLNESGFFETPLQLEDYGWPGHNRKATVQDIKNETDTLIAKFTKCFAENEITDDQVYAHPAGIQQFYGDVAMVNEAPRYKFRLFLNTRYQTYHQTGIYMPPGEIITIEIPDRGRNVLYAIINRHAQNEGSYGITYRLPKLFAEIKLLYIVNKISWPYGGNLIIFARPDTYNAGIDVNISGGIKMPYFKYGVTTDEEWEETISKNPAPLMFLDNGAQVITMPSSYGRDGVKINDAMAFWRGVSRVLYSINEVYAYPRRGDGRILNSVEIHLDSYVAIGSAYALTGRSTIQMPPSWGTAYVNYDSARWGCWGNVHELGHHFQQNWGAGRLDQYGEVTNNVLNLISYAMMCEMTERRVIDASGGIYTPGDWNWMTHPYGTINMRELLPFYANYLYWFGPDLWRKILHKHINSLQLRKQLGYHGEFLYNLCTMSGFDVRPYYKQFDNGDTLNYTRDVSQEVHDMIDNLNLPELHPVATIYQTGYIFNGSEIETARPFIIPAWIPYRFDFARFKRSATGCHEFEFVNVTGGEGTFEHIKDGKYWYKPVKNLSYVDKFYVNYRDVANNRITTCVCQVRQQTKGHNVYFLRIDTAMDRFVAYQYFLDHFDEATHQIGSAMTISGGGNGIWLGVAEGVFIPPKTAPYTFLFKHHDDMIFYLSENPLKGNMTEDQSYLLAESPGERNYYNERQTSKTVNLEEGKSYYFRFFMQNRKTSATEGSVAYINYKGMKPVEITASQARFPNFNDSEEIHYQFVPRMENDPTLGHYYESRTIKYDSTVFSVTGNFEPVQQGVNISALLCDLIYNNNQPVQVRSSLMPLTYDIDFGDPITFDRLYIPNVDNKIDGEMSFACDGEEFFRGSYKPTTDFPAVRCKNLNISILSNTFGNVSSLGEIKPVLMTAGTTDNIIPATHTKFKIEGPGELSNCGIYYNGKGWHLNETARLTSFVRLNSSGDSIVIIGDRHRYYGGGVLEVYLDGEFHGTVNTGFIHPDYYSAMITNDYFQQPLYCIHNLQPDTYHNLTLAVRSGKVEVAGLLANAELVEEMPPSPEITPESTPTETTTETTTDTIITTTTTTTTEFDSDTTTTEITTDSITTTDITTTTTTEIITDSTTTTTDFTTDTATEITTDTSSTESSTELSTETTTTAKDTTTTEAAIEPPEELIESPTEKHIDEPAKEPTKELTNEPKDESTLAQTNEISTNTDPAAAKENGTKSTKKVTFISVGVVVGLLVIGAAVAGGIIYYKRSHGIEEDSDLSHENSELVAFYAV